MEAVAGSVVHDGLCRGGAVNVACKSRPDAPESSSSEEEESEEDEPEEDTGADKKALAGLMGADY